MNIAHTQSPTILPQVNALALAYVIMPRILMVLCIYYYGIAIAMDLTAIFVCTKEARESAGE